MTLTLTLVSAVTLTLTLTFSVGELLLRRPRLFALHRVDVGHRLQRRLFGGVGALQNAHLLLLLLPLLYIGRRRRRRRRITS